MNMRKHIIAACMAVSMTAIPFQMAAQATERTISSVESVSVSTPVGTVPRLPYQLLVTYSDGTQAYRQVRWSNAALATEQEQANYTAGKTYTIEGYITGDDTTPNPLK